jgi:RNA polymerase sigma factor (sigma-70 family)
MMQLIEKHYRENFNTLVKRMTWRCGGSVQDAEDIIQEAYLRAIKYRDAFIEGNVFTYWFARIIDNVFKDFKRAEREMGGIEDEEEEIIEDYHLSEGVRRELRKEMEKLPFDLKEIITLHMVYSYTIGQIVQITNTPYREVDNQIEKFKKNILGKYAKYQY